MGVVHWGQTSEGDSCRCYLSSTICHHVTKSLLHASTTSERLHPPFPVMMAFPSFKLFPAGHNSEENTYVPGQLKMDSCRAFPACHSALYPFGRGLASASEAHSPRITSELPLESQGKGWGDLTVLQVLHPAKPRGQRHCECSELPEAALTLCH